MKVKLFTIFFSILLTSGSAAAQISWLDRPITNWNSRVEAVPRAPRATGDVSTILRCRDVVRSADSIADKAVTRAGWTLFGASQTYGPVTVVSGMASVDGMCRPLQYNSFVFVSNRFAGTLSPDEMNARTDGSLANFRLNSPTSISAEFMRYTSNDPMCCPSQTSSVVYSIAAGRVTADTVNTEANCKNNNTEPEVGSENTVTGKINLSTRLGRLRNSSVTIRLVDVTQTNPTVVAEQKLDINGNQQFPISYELKYEPNRINRRNRYAVQAEMVRNNRTFARTETNYFVLTQGNPSTIDITLNPVAFGNQQNNSTLRGTVSYRERMALPGNAVVTVELMDAAVNAADAEPIAETTFTTNNRQVPLTFELGYNRNQIDLRRRYVVRAEISIDNTVRWKTETDVPVLTLGGPADNVQLNLVQAQLSPAAITGRTLSISKFGTGSFQIEGKGSTFLVRGSVNVRSDGSADVTVGGITGGVTFSGKLTAFDERTLRITVESSGNADASGEIEVKYNGRRLESISSTNLVLDGQNTTLRF